MDIINYAKIKKVETLIPKKINLANLFDKNTITPSMYVDKNGNFLDSISRNLSDFIPVVGMSRIAVKRLRGYGFYDINKTFISGNQVDYPNGLVIDVPLNAFYFRFSYYKSFIPDELQMVVEGEEIPEVYVPYGYSQPHLIINKENLSNDIKEALVTEGNTILSPKDELILQTNNGWQDFTCLGDYILTAIRSDGEDNSYGTNGTITFINKFGDTVKILKHDFGHCNTVDYCEETDCLIFGNGSGYYDLDGYIYIIQGVLHWLDFPDNHQLLLSGITGSTITTIPVYRLFGDKVNVVWGERNNGKNNICYVISNDNQNFRKVILGIGSTQLESGIFESGKSDSEFNGTYKILKEWTTPELAVNQGTCYYNGCLYGNLGHSGSWLVKYTPKDDGTIEIIQKREFLYDENGGVVSLANGGGSGNGVFIKDGFIYHSTNAGMNYVRKYPVF